MAKNRSWTAWATFGLLAAAITKELRKPERERAWNGRVAGVVPYDLRPPSVERIRSRVWDPDNPKIVMPQVFGVGWTLNLGRVTRLVRQRLGD
ncbi:MAG: hypothetical protein H0U16_11355 [Actinobacteria bacterium]|nr:hypothetical protein [Actinomycetota bacterium]